MSRSVLLLLITLLFPHTAPAAGVRFYGDLQLARGVESYLTTHGDRDLRAALVPFLTRDAVHAVNLEGAAGDPASCADRGELCFVFGAERLALLDGFDIVSLQNNHALDAGPAGLRNTLRALTEYRLTPLGGRNFSTRVPSPDGMIGVVAVTDVVNAPTDRNHVIAADGPEVFAEIQRLRQQTTAVAVYVHWGRELLPIATQRNRDLARRYLSAGADVVVGTHPHVTAPVECIDGKPVVYSLGNFLFDQKYAETKQGAVLDCRISDYLLTCSLEGHRTPDNSYLPAPVTGAYQKQNSQLADCSVPVEPTWTGVFGRDQKEKRLVLRRDEAKEGLSYLELYDCGTGKLEIRTPSMPIVKLQLVDLNMDGIQELLLIQNLYSSLDREVAKRIYIYSLNGTFHALWRGSALSRPLLDAVFVEREGKDPVLVALHSADSFLRRDKNARERIVMGYRWNGFGFSGLGEQRLATSANGINYRKGRVRLTANERLVTEISPEPLCMQQH